MGVLNSAKNIAKATAKFSIPGLMDEVIGHTIGTGFGAVTGLGRGIIGLKPNLKTGSLLHKGLHGTGYVVGKTANLAFRPVYTVGKKLAKNTVKHTGHNATKTVKGIGKAIFKDAKPGSEFSFMGKETRPWFAWALTGGAVGYGLMQGAKDDDIALGLKTLQNGVLDTQGCANISDTVNQSFTPVSKRHRKSLEDLGVSGDLPFALHNMRNSGYL